MRAIILAAGKGRRLRPITDETHKCLLEFGGRTLIQRYLDDFEQLGIHKVTLVLGHKMDMVRDHVGTQRGSVQIDYLENPLHHRGSILSMAIASQHFDDDVVIMDADVLYHPELLRCLVQSNNTNCQLMDHSYTETGEECKVAALQGRVVANNRVIEVPYDEIGEGLGFLRLNQNSAQRYRELLYDFMKDDNFDCEYEDPLEMLMKEHIVGFEPTGGLPWCEIDFVEDIEHARNNVLPSIEARLKDASISPS